MASLHHKVKLRKLVKEHMKTRVSWLNLRDNIVYCEGETSTNLSSCTASTDLGFKHREADTVMLSAYGKLPKILVLDSEDTDWCTQAAAVSHQLQGNLLIKSKNGFFSCSAVLSEHVANIIMPLYVITSSDHTSVWLLWPWQKETAATSDQ